MNVLQIIPSLDVGGVETGTVDLARYLVAQGHRAVVISSGGELVKELEEAHATHYTLPVDKKSVMSAFMTVREVCGIIRREAIDVVHVRSRVPGWIGFFASRITKRPFITTAHGYYRQHVLSDVMSWGKFVIVASHVMAKHMIHTFGVPFDRIRLIPRGVDLNRFAFRDPADRSSGDFTVGIIARITPLKGHTHFLKAMGIAYRSIPNLKILIVGESPKSKERYRQELELLTKRLGLGRTVEFMGTRKDIQKILERLDVLVSSTVTPEAFGRSIIEAQAAGVPVVSTKVGGVVDIIEDGKNGIFVNPEDPKGMAEAIIRLSKDKKLRQTLARNGRQNVERNFTLEQMAEKTLEVYAEAIATKRIMVVKIGSLGDCILSMPSLRAIRNHARHDSIKLLVGLKSRDVFNNCPYIDDRIVYDAEQRDRGIMGLLKLTRAIVKDNVDLVIDLQNNKKSHLIDFLSMAPERYGYRDKKLGFLLNKGIKDTRNGTLDPVEHQFQVLRAAGIEPSDKRLELFPSVSDQEWAKGFIESNWVKPGQNLVGINLRSSPRWVTKNWPLEYTATLCNRLAVECNVRVVITGSREDLGIVERLRRQTDSKPIIAVGKTTLLQLACMMRYFKVYLTADSAPLHVAASAGIPVIGLFGPTDPARHTVPAENLIIMRKDVGCGPCYNPRCWRGAACMRLITVDEVFDAIRCFLTGNREERIDETQPILLHEKDEPPAPRQDAERIN